MQYQFTLSLGQMSWLESPPRDNARAQATGPKPNLKRSLNVVCSNYLLVSSQNRGAWETSQVAGNVDRAFQALPRQPRRSGEPAL